MNEKVLAGCMGKTRYLSSAAAKRVIRHREKTGRIHTKGRGTLTAYKCRNCPHFHVGSESQ